MECLHFACRTLTFQCDAIRPSCSRCNGLELPCEYDVGKGVSRAERFKMQKERKSSIANNFSAIVDALRSSSDAEATTILARLRLGELVVELAQFLRTNNSFVLQNSLQTSAITPELFPHRTSGSALPILDMPADHLTRP